MVLAKKEVRASFFFIRNIFGGDVVEKKCTIAILGGTGKVGVHVANQAIQDGYDVRLLVRNPDKVKNNGERVQLVKGDAQNKEDLRSLLKGSRIVINCFGQPLKAEPIYSEVTNNLLSIMGEYHINRYIGVTGASLTIQGDMKKWLNSLGAKVFECIFSKMINDKRKEHNILLHSNSNWTLVRLPFVKEGVEIKRVKENLTDMPGSIINNGTIAKFLIEQVEDHRYIRKAPFISN